MGEIYEFLLKGEAKLVTAFISGPYSKIVQKVQPANKPAGLFGRKNLDEILLSNRTLNRLSLDEQNFLIVFTDLFQADSLLPSNAPSSNKSLYSLLRFRELLPLIGRDFVRSEKFPTQGYTDLYLNISSQILFEVAKLHYMSLSIEHIPQPANYFSSKPEGEASLPTSHVLMSFHREFRSFLKDKAIYGTALSRNKDSLILIIDNLTAAVEKEYDRTECNDQLTALKIQLMPFFPSVGSFLKPEIGQVPLYSRLRDLQLFTCEPEGVDLSVVAQIRILTMQL